MSQVVPSSLRPAKFSTFPTWLLICTTLLTTLVASASIRYFFPSIPIPSLIASNSYRYPWLAIHIASATIALLVGPVQFFSKLRLRYPKQHRLTGRLYAASCLIGGVSGLVLAAGASTGWVSTAGFGLLAVAWMLTTTMGWRTAMRRQFDQHRSWMIRSFALTLAAVTLRIYLPISQFLPVEPEAAYQAISFLCWVPNALLAEYYLGKKIRIYKPVLNAN